MSIHPISLILAFLITSLLILPGNHPVQSQSTTFQVLPLEYSSVDRTWEDISLLYPDSFHSSSQIQDELHRFEELVPDLIELVDIGQTHHGQAMQAVVVTNELNTQQKPKLMIASGHHARELITDEMALRIIQQVLNLYGQESELTEIIDTLEIHIVPAVNADSRDQVLENNKPWLRKNLVPHDDDGDGASDEDGPEDVNQDGSVSCFDVFLKETADDTSPSYVPSSYECTYFEGIDNDGDGLINEDHAGYTDLNRNYPAGWGEAGSNIIDPRSQVYAGREPFSEPETRAMRDFVSQHRYSWAASLHSGINATWFPLVNNQYSPLHWQLFNTLLQYLPPSYDDWLNGANLAEEFHSGEFGLWRSYMDEDRASRAPFTFELWRDALAANEHPATYFVHLENDTHLIMEYTGIEEFFNPAASKINHLFEELWPAFGYMMASTPRLSAELELSLGADNQMELHYEISLSDSPFRSDPIVLLYNDQSFDLTGRLDSRRSSSFSHPDLIFDGSETLKLGNSYEGYLEFRIGDETTRITQDRAGNALLQLAGISLLMVVIFSRRMLRRPQLG